MTRRAQLAGLTGTAILGILLAATTASAASLIVNAGNLQIFVLPGPPHPVAVPVRVEPQTIVLAESGGHRTISAFVGPLPPPYLLTELLPSSIRLCYLDTCIPSSGETQADSSHVRATFSGSSFAAMVGADRGAISLVVRGGLTGYPAGFVGQASVTTRSRSDAVAPADGATVAPTGAGSAISPVPGPSSDPLSPTPSPAPSPTVTPGPTAEPAPTVPIPPEPTTAPDSPSPIP